jgi:hypothetical protein
MKRNLLFLIFAAVLLLVIALFSRQLKPVPQPSKVGSFTDCVKAGYQVLETYPRQCRTPDGRLFVEVLKEPR